MTSTIATAEHNLEHNSPFWGVIPKSIILDFGSIMCQPVPLSCVPSSVSSTVSFLLDEFVVVNIQIRN